MGCRIQTRSVSRLKREVDPVTRLPRLPAGGNDWLAGSEASAVGFQGAPRRDPMCTRLDAANRRITLCIYTTLAVHFQYHFAPYHLCRRLQFIGRRCLDWTCNKIKPRAGNSAFTTYYLKTNQGGWALKGFSFLCQEVIFKCCFHSTRICEM